MSCLELSNDPIEQQEAINVIKAHRNNIILTRGREAKQMKNCQQYNTNKRREKHKLFRHKKILRIGELKNKNKKTREGTNFENTWIRSCSIQVGSTLGTKRVGHEELFCEKIGAKELCCQCKKYHVIL